MSKWSIKIPLRFEKPKVLFFSVERDGKEVYSKSISNCEDLTQKDRYLYADLNELWHDVEEEPVKGAWIISECDKGYRNIVWGSLQHSTWSEYACYHGVRRWAYIAALLPID